MREINSIYMEVGHWCQDCFDEYSVIYFGEKRKLRTKNEILELSDQLRHALGRNSDDEEE